MPAAPLAAQLRAVGETATPTRGDTKAGPGCTGVAAVTRIG